MSMSQFYLSHAHTQAQAHAFDLGHTLSVPMVYPSRERLRSLPVCMCDRTKERFQIFLNVSVKSVHINHKFILRSK